MKISICTQKTMVASMAGGLLLVATAGASAQAFEAVCGQANAVEQGSRRVKAVTNCGTGYIAVGTTTPSVGGTSDVYVVRTAASGATLFEVRYNLAATGSNDVGMSIAELTQGGNTGFVVLGTTNRATANTDIFLMRISCTGAPLWTQVYTTAGTNDQAGDIVEALYGNAAVGTQPGDLLVSGTIDNLAGSATQTDGLLFRARAANGALLWNRRYDFASTSVVFRGLTEARPTSVAASGDIVVGGRSTVTGAPAQAYGQRVSGDNGGFTTALHCAARYGGTTGAETFESVVELRANPDAAGHLLFAGAYVPTATPGASDMYVARTNRNPCQLVAQRTIGEPPTGPTFGNEAASDVQELRSTLPYAAAGRAVLTGFVGIPGTAADDLPLLAIDTTSLIPVAGTGRLFGDHATRRERGISLFSHANGIVLAGFSESVPNDPRDLFLVSTNNQGRTNCNNVWVTPHYSQSWAPQTVQPVSASVLQSFVVVASGVSQNTAQLTCP